QDLLPSTFTAQASRWQDDIAPEAANTVAVFAEGHLKGKPAILDHHTGQGSAIYIGTQLSQESLEQLITAFIERSAVESPHAAPQDVEVTERHTSHHRFLFFLNHSATPKTLELEITGKEILGNRQVTKGEEITLEASDVAVIQVKR
ncbi:MAG TPA: Beta-galactosidase C-terminal domain, partial [Arthrobacter sp.]|nr:Beta-galactosidase C-terminal domain [Arthrobacter sp.]